MDLNQKQCGKMDNIMYIISAQYEARHAKHVQDICIDTGKTEQHVCCPSSKHKVVTILKNHANVLINKNDH